VRQEADADANIIVGATFDDELDGSIRVSVVATGIGTAQIEMRPTTPQERSRLSARLAGLATLPGTPVDLDEPSLVLGESEMVNDGPVWRAPGNVTIERRPAQKVAAIAPVAMAQPKSTPQTPSRPFQPAPPVAIKRPVRRMPAMEDLPVVAQSEIKAKSGDVPVIGLAAQKKKVGFLERLANVGRLRKEDDETPAKREPEFERPWGELPKQAERPKPEAEAAPRGIRIERPRGEKVVAALPKLVEVQAAPDADEREEAPDESLVDDDLEIPAFLRRRAN
jgi:cell division protein FtsZ